jgi:hypothetical protein
MECPANANIMNNNIMIRYDLDFILVFLLKCWLMRRGTFPSSLLAIKGNLKPSALSPFRHLIVHFPLPSSIHGQTGSTFGGALKLG